ncbi:MAG: hypothetical protein KDA91_01630 [Planctomycetaceae bacterium]|nr:hypothetical protein [Planctomycetaceae bacterium]
MAGTSTGSESANKAPRQQEMRGDAPEYSVRVKTEADWIYIAEFRTWEEAISLAESAAERSHLVTQVRRCGTVVRELQPVSVVSGE